MTLRANWLSLTRCIDPHWMGLKFCHGPVTRKSFQVWCSLLLVLLFYRSIPSSKGTTVTSCDITSPLSHANTVRGPCLGGQYRGRGNCNHVPFWVTCAARKCCYMKKTHFPLLQQYGVRGSLISWGAMSRVPFRMRELLFNGPNLSRRTMTLGL
jgi:hypothetical protein